MFEGRGRKAGTRWALIENLFYIVQSENIPHICREPHEYIRVIFFWPVYVNFYRFNAKNWQFTEYFAVITQKIGNFLCILS